MKVVSFYMWIKQIKPDFIIYIVHVYFLASKAGEEEFKGKSLRSFESIVKLSCSAWRNVSLVKE